MAEAGLVRATGGEAAEPVIEQLAQLIGKQVSFMLVGTAPAFWGPYELVSVQTDFNESTTGSFPLRAVAVLQGKSNRYLVNLDHIVVAREEKPSL